MNAVLTAPPLCRPRPVISCICMLRLHPSCILRVTVAIMVVQSARIAGFHSDLMHIKGWYRTDWAPLLCWLRVVIVCVSIIRLRPSILPWFILRVNTATRAPLPCYVKGLLRVCVIFRVKIATRAPLLRCVKGLLGVCLILRVNIATRAPLLYTHTSVLATPC